MVIVTVNVWESGNGNSSGAKIIVCILPTLRTISRCHRLLDFMNDNSTIKPAIGNSRNRETYG